MKEYLDPKHVNDSKKKMVSLFFLLCCVLSFLPPVFMPMTLMHLLSMSYCFNDFIICNVDFDV